MAAPALVNPYEQIWKTRDLRSLNTPVELNNKLPEWRRGLGAFGKEMQATGYGLAALGSQGLENLIGENQVTKGITDWGLEGYNKASQESQTGLNAPSVARVEDIKNASDVMKWGGYQLGKGIPMLGTLALGGGLGGAIARVGANQGVKALAKSAVGSAVKQAVKTKAIQAAEGEVVTSAMKQAAANALRSTFEKGAIAGGFAGSFGLEGGQAFGEQTAEGVNPADAVKSAIAVGGINGALEFLPFYSAAKSIGMGQYAKKSIARVIADNPDLSKRAIALAGEVGGRALKGGAVGAGAEGITEGLQELVSIAGQRWAEKEPLFADLTPEDWWRIKNATAAGALVGGVAMGAGATIGGPQAQERVTPTEVPTQTSTATSPVDQTRAQALEAMRNEANANLAAARATGDTNKVEELQKIKGLYDRALGTQPVQEVPPVEAPQEVTPPVQETSLEVPTLPATTPNVPPIEALESSVDAAARIQARDSLLNNTLQVVTEQEAIAAVKANPNYNVEDLADGSVGIVGVLDPDTNSWVGKQPAIQQTTPIEQPAVAQPGGTIQLKRGEEVILTPPDQQETRAFSTAEEKANLQQLLGERPTQPEVTPNAKEVQTQTEAPAQTEALVDIKYSMPVWQPLAGEATMEEFEAVRKQFQERQKQETPFKNWFGKGVSGVTADSTGTPITLYHGTNNPIFNQWDSSRAGEASSYPTSGLGFFMTADKGAAARYGDNLMALHAKINNPYELTDADLTSIETKEDAAKLRKKLMAKGYDGAVVKAPGAKPYVIAFESKQVKFVTNEKPTESPDFRYSMPTEEEQKIVGEAESYLTQARQGMTEEERRAVSPESMQEYPSEDQVIVAQGGKPLGAEQAPTIRSVTPNELRANINSLMGEGWIQQAEAAGVVEIIDGPGLRGESGSWAGDKFRLYTQTMPANGSPAGVLLHEGSHAPTFKGILGDSLEMYLKDLDTLADNGNKSARNAITQATIAVADVLGIKHNLMQGGNKTDLKNVQALIEERRPGLLAEEKLAYFIQYGSETKEGAGFLRRLINAIKAWFAQTKLGQALKQAGIGFELNEAMAVEWAKESLRSTLAEAQQAAKAMEQVIAEAKQMSPSERLGRVLNPQYSYAGPKAATANNVSLQQAKQRVDNNEDAEVVRKEIGWFKGKDGKWRFEIDDSELSFNNEWIEQQRKEKVVSPQEVAEDFEGVDLGAWEPDTQWSQGEKETKNLDEGDFSDRFETTIGQLVNHTKLFEAYPQLRNIEVDFLVNTRGTFDPQGSYNVAGNNIDIKAYTYESARKILIHELQHAVQAIEGFAAGGAPNNPTYLRLAGEIEARDTARRLNLTPEQRQEKQPYTETLFRDGIADEDIITSQPGDVYYSMGLQEFKDTLWTDPTDSRQEMVNKPGLLQKLRADFVDFFADMEKKSPKIYDVYSLMRNKKAARLIQARQEYMLPLRELIANSPWSAEEVGDMLAARHIKVDKVNTQLAERASANYTKELLKALPKAQQKELMKERVNVKAGKMPDGSDYVDINGNPATMSNATKRKMMFDLMNKYAPFEVKNQNGEQLLREEWELFKDAAGGFSDGGVAAGKVRTTSDVLTGVSKDKARFDKIANLFDAMNRHALQIREDGGLITPAEHSRLLADKTAYAPLRRESYNVNREIERLFQRAGQGGSKQLGTRAGTTALSEPTLVLQNALAALEASAAAAERNLANKELYEVVSADRAGWKPWFSIVTEDKYVTHDEDGFLQEKNATASNQADITLIKDGKKIVIRPNMHNERAMGFVRAVNNLDAQTLNGPMKVLGWLNNIVRWVNVSASPVFLMMNAIRDPFTAAYNMQASEAAPYTKQIFENYGKAFKALKKVFIDGNRDPNDPDVQMVERFENAGGRTSFIEALQQSDDTWRSFDAQVARRQGNFKQLMAVKDKWIDGIENLNILFENVMRLSTFDTLTQNGVSATRAARISQDLTTNFTRRGYKTQALGTWWLFFNASVQGNYQVLRNLLSSKRVQIAAGSTIAFALMLDLLGRAVADDWDEIPEWDKERFIILPVKVGGDFVKIPAPWVYNIVWRTGGMLGEMLSGVRKPQDTLLDIASMTATTLSPLGKPGSIAQMAAPTAADPFVQILENKDFAGNPIGPEGFPGASSKANSELLWNNTPKGYQSLARWVNEFTGGSAAESGAVDLRPGDYQILAKFLTGSLGRFLSDATFGLKEGLEKGVEGPKDIPVVKEFFSDPYNPMRSQTYHTNIAAVYGAHKLEKMYREGPDRDLVKLHEVRKERDKELRLYTQAQDVERQIKSLRVRIRAAENRKEDARVKELRGRIEEVQDKFNRSYQRRMD